MATATRKTSPARALTAEALMAEDLLRMSPEALDDYSRSSLPFRPIRDEIRLVAPGLYLGVVWWRRTETVHFALTFR